MNCFVVGMRGIRAKISVLAVADESAFRQEYAVIGFQNFVIALVPFVIKNGHYLPNGCRPFLRYLNMQDL